MTRDAIRIAIVSPALQGGGAEYQISLLIQALLRAGNFEVFYFARHVDDRHIDKGYRVVRIGRGLGAPRFGYVTDCIPLYRALSRVRPQVIYQRVACGYTGICALYARRQHSTLVWHVAHDTDVAPQTLDYGRNPLRRRLEKWSVEFGLRHAHRIVVQTQQQSDLLSVHYGRVADALIPNYDAPSAENLSKDPRPVIAWIANLKPWKRPEIFVRLAQQLSTISEAQFVMVGQAPSQTRGGRWYADLQQGIVSTPNLSYLGYCDQQQVRALLARARIFVNTSLHEGFPNTFIQAWMRDTVVVSLDVNPDGVFDREGVGVHAGTECMLVDTVRHLLTDPAARVPFIERARRYVVSRHGLHNVEVLVRLLEDCAQPAVPRAGGPMISSLVVDADRLSGRQ